MASAAMLVLGDGTAGASDELKNNKMKEKHDDDVDEAESYPTL